MKWNAKSNRESNKALEEKTNLLRHLQQEEGTNETEAIKKLDKEVNVLLEQEDTKWCQRARQNWYVEAFIGIINKEKWVFIGKNGKIWEYLKDVVAWDSKIQKHSTMLCLSNNYKGC